MIITGSKSDFQLLAELEDLFKNSKVDYDIKVASCHRDLDDLQELLKDLKRRNNYKVVLAIANAVSNMPAIVASYLKDTPIIVIGVGLDNKGLNGLDSLLSVNTIPKGVPLVSTGVGATALYNAGLFAIKLLKE